MKRITILAVLAVALFVIAMPAMADTQFAWSGEITSQFQTDFTTSAELVSTANITLAVTINPNLSFTGLIITTANTTDGGTGALTNGNGAYYATVQLGNILKLDPKTVTEAVSIGNFDADPTTYYATAIADENVFGADFTGGALTISSLTGIMNMVNVLVAVDPGSFFGGTAAYLAEAYGTVGPISAALGYGSNNSLGANAEYTGTFGNIGVVAALQGEYNTTAASWNLGLGAKVTYKTLLTAAVGGAYGSAGLGNICFNVDVAPVTNFGADVYGNILGQGGAGYSAGIGYIDGSVWTKLDASTLRLGYVYTTPSYFTATAATGGYNVAQLNTGGLYLEYDLTF